MIFLLKHFYRVLAIFILTVGLSAQAVTIQSASGLNVTLGGEVEMEFIDVEGPGGFSNQDLTVKKVKNRSPHMRIDKAVLIAKVDYNENLYYNFEFRFSDDRAFIAKHYARLNIPSINTQFELGKNKPMVATKRRTEGYPLIGTAFWKGREYHITSETKTEMGPFKITGGLSFAMKRPIGTDDAAEDKSFKMLVYDNYDSKDGQTFEYGTSLGLKAFGLSAQGWYYTGKLIDDFDWKMSLGFMSGYNDYAKSTEGVEKDDMTHYWYGGRVGFDQGNLHTRVEYIKAMDGWLPRSGYYVEGSYDVNLKKGRSISPIVRVGELNLGLLYPSLGDPSTWGRSLTTVGLLAKLNNFLSMKVEYYLVGETTGGKVTTNSEGLVVDNSFVKDNQLLMQIKYEF